MKLELNTAKIAKDYGITPSHDIGRAIEAGADAMHKLDIEWLAERVVILAGNLVYLRVEDWQAFLREQR